MEKTQVSESTLLPRTGPANAFYTGNRPPLTPSPAIKLPVGAVRPEGWLRHMLALEAEGMVGHLEKLSKWVQFEGNAWSSPDGRGDHFWEEMPYWFKGYVVLAYLTDDPRLKSQVGRWIDALVASRRSDGYFGPEALREQVLDLWPHMIMLYALRSHWEATGDPRIVPLISGFMGWLRTVPPERLYVWKPHDRSWWQWIRAADMLDHILWTYNQTGEAWLIDLARVNHERTAPWSREIPSWHGVNICQSFRGPAQFYQVSGDPRFVTATLRIYDTVMGIYGQVPGGMFGADENCREGYIGPRQAAETCSMVEFMFSFENLVRIIGDPVWADRCEEVAFNSLPAAMTAELKALKYLTAPNQIQLDRTEKSPMIENRGDMFSFSPYEQYRCCQHNVSHGWPYFVEHLWAATPGNGLAAVMYAPCRVRARVGDGTEVQIVVRTGYPFSEEVEMTLELPAGRQVSFPLSLRIPGWCDDADVDVNGVEVADDLDSGQWITIERTWSHGDRVRLELSMELETRLWAGNGNALSVHRGPLAYSLRIAERYVPYQMPPAADQPPRSPDWPGYEVFPDSPWNYALLIDRDDPEESFTIRLRPGPLADQPFTLEAAPIVLEARARRLPEWKQEANGLIGPQPVSPVTSSEPIETVQLVPMGCARLRVTAFPWMEAPASLKR